jgi:hypothetical protein
MEGVIPCNLSQYHPRTLHIVHNTSHAFKVKQTQYFISIGTICTVACLAQRKKLEFMVFHEVVPKL